MMKGYIRALALAATVGWLGGLTAATPVNPGDYTGHRESGGGGITGTTPWSNKGVFELDWKITQAGPIFHYWYKLEADQKDPSHMIFELSESITPQNVNSVIMNMKLEGKSIATPVPTLYSPSDPGNSNPGLPGEIYGMKIDFPYGDDEWVLTFDSTRAPMWGDFYAKDGKSGNHFVYAYNTGFGTDPASNLYSYKPWIPIPDTKDVPVPEPSTYLLLMTVLGFGLAVTHRRRTKTA